MIIKVFNGSPKGQKSVSHRMVKSFLAGAKSAGADTEEIILSRKNILHCMGCFSCWTRTPGKCVIKDDMSSLIEKMKQADLIIYACPVYVGGVTGIMKDFIDRTIPLADPHFEKNSDGEYKHVERYDKQPTIGIISNCGFPDIHQFKYFRSVFTFMEENGGAKIVAEIYRTMGPLLESDDPRLKPIIDNYLETLHQAGREVTEQGSLPEETRKKLEIQLIPPESYIEEGNKYWDKMLDKIKK